MIVYFNRALRTFVLLILLLSSPAARSAETIVELYGNLQVNGNQILGQHGEPAMLRGMSLFWSQWIGKYYTEECIEWLKDDWNCTVIRAAVAPEYGGYLENPEAEWAKLETVVEACIDLGIYVLVDWHSHNAHEYTEESIAFFTRVAEEYGDYPNVIYEIYNEPLQISWVNLVKPYADTVAAAIRQIDPDNLILVGTTTWSQDVTAPINYPVNDNNVAYTLHFYAATHTQWLRTRAQTALNGGVPLFVSEFGTCESSGDGAINYDETTAWMQFMEDHHISWCNWSVADKDETSAALKSGASAEGGWPDDALSESGALIRSLLRQYNETVLSHVPEKSPVQQPKTIQLMQNYPNPFNATTRIQFNLSSPEWVTLDVFDVAGQRVSTLVDGLLQQGSHSACFNGDDLASGVYRYRLATPLVCDMKSMVLMK